MDDNEMTLPGRGEIQAYISEGNFICLKQSDMHDESIVMMAKTDVPIIIEWLSQLYEEFDDPHEAIRNIRGNKIQNAK